MKQGKRWLDTRGWIIFGAVTLALVVRTWFVSTAWVDRPVRGDALDYVSYATNLVQHGVFSRDVHAARPAPDSYRDPGYPVFFALFIATIKQAAARLAVLQWTQALLGALTVGNYLLLVQRRLSAPWLALAGLVMALWPHSITAPLYLLTEALVGFLASLGLLLVVRGIEHGSAGRVATGGITFGLAGLTNAVLAPFAILIALGGFALDGRRRGLYTILLVTGAVLPAAWALRNLALPPAPSASSRAAANFVQGSYADYHRAWRAVDTGDARAKKTIDAISHEVAVAMDAPIQGVHSVFARISARPWLYMGWYAYKPVLLWSWDMQIAGGHIYVFPTQGSGLQRPGWRHMVQVFIMLNPWLSALMLLGCILIAARRGPVPCTVMAALVTYVTLVYSLLQAEPRYAVPFRGAEITLAVATLAWLSHLARRRMRVASYDM